MSRLEAPKPREVHRAALTAAAATGPDQGRRSVITGHRSYNDSSAQGGVAVNQNKPFPDATSVNILVMIEVSRLYYS